MTGFRCARWTAALVALVSAAVLAGPVQAQTPPDDPEPGDFFWQFARSGPVADQRVEQALMLLVDSDAVLAEAAVDDTARLVYGDEQIRTFAKEQSREEWEPLLTAAGYPEPSNDLSEARRCRFWTPAGFDDDAERTAVATALGAALADILSDIGITAQPCEVIDDSDQADLFVWSFGQDLEVCGWSGGSGGGLVLDGEPGTPRDAARPWDRWGAVAGGGG